MAAIWHVKLSQEKHKAESVFPRPYNPQWRCHDTHCSFADVAHRSQKVFLGCGGVTRGLNVKQASSIAMKCLCSC